MGAVLPARAPQAESQLFTASLPALSWHSWSKTNTVLFEQLESDINSNGKNKIYLLIKNLSSYRWKRFLQISLRLSKFEFLTSATSTDLGGQIWGHLISKGQRWSCKLFRLLRFKKLSKFEFLTSATSTDLGGQIWGHLVLLNWRFYAKCLESIIIEKMKKSIFLEENDASGHLCCY